MEQPEYEQMYRWEDVHWWFVSKRRVAATVLERWLVPDSAAKVLDVGCGTGGNLPFLAGWGEVVGLDLSPLALNLARCRRAAWLTRASGLTLPYVNDSFSLVTAFDVLYHRWIVDDNQAIEECYRVLRPGGWFLVTDSALPALWSAHDEVYYARQRYTLADIHRKLSGAGFQVKVCSYKNALLLPAFGAARLVMRLFPQTIDFDFRPPPSWLNRLLIGLHGLEGAWLGQDRVIPIGSSVICLAQKPAYTSRGAE